MSRALQQNPTGPGYVELGDADTLNVGQVQLVTGVVANAILDEDALVSDSDTAVPTQQSVKAYADDILTRKHTILAAGTVAVDSFPDTDGLACVWDYVVWRGGNMRAGTITAAWHAASNTVTMNEVSTADLGGTGDVTFNVAIDIGTDLLELRVTVVGALPWDVLVSRLRLHTP